MSHPSNAQRLFYSALIVVLCCSAFATVPASALSRGPGIETVTMASITGITKPAIKEVLTCENQKFVVVGTNLGSSVSLYHGSESILVSDIQVTPTEVSFTASYCWTRGTYTIIIENQPEQVDSWSFGLGPAPSQVLQKSDCPEPAYERDW